MTSTKIVAKTRRWPNRMRLRAQRKRRAGSIAVIVALSFVALCGFTALSTDYGQMVWWRNQLQRSCDASALAGASQLPNALNAQTVAGTVAGQNGLAAPGYGWPNGLRQIQVSGARTVNFGFAGVIGIKSADVKASAIAGRLPLKGVPFNVPLAITTTDYALYKNGTSFEPLLIDNNRQDFVPGDLTALDLRPDGSGKSGAVFQDDLLNSYPGTIYLNQPIDNSLNASLSSQGPKLEQALSQRISDAAAAPYADNGSKYTFPDYPPNDRRIVTLIVADPHPVDNNNPVVTARAIVAVYIESVRSPGNSSNYYVRMRILPNKLYHTDDPGVVVGDDTTPDNGLAVVQLLN